MPDQPAHTHIQPLAPFWRQLPFFFLFPLRLPQVLVLGGIVGASALAALLLGSAGLLLKGLLGFAGLRYGFHVLERFSQGVFEPHPGAHRLWGGKERRPLKFALLLGLFLSVAASVGAGNVAGALAAHGEVAQDMLPAFGDPLWIQLQPAWYWVLMLAASLGLPAAALVVALDDRFFRALNPMRTLHYMRAMGGAYFLLWVFFLAIAGSREIALGAGETLPASLRFPLEMALATYFGIVLFALMGYALFQFREALGLQQAPAEP